MKFILVVAAVVGAVVNGQQCAKDYKGFQHCIESWAANYSIGKPPPRTGQRPSPAMLIENAAKCFSDNNCTIALPSPPPSSIPDFPEEEAGGPPKMSEAEADEILARFRCEERIIEKHLKADLLACVQEKIPGWTFPVLPAENTLDPFDPYAQAKYSPERFHLWNVARRTKYAPKPPADSQLSSKPELRKKRNVLPFPDPHLDLDGPGGPQESLKRIAAEVYNSDACAVSNRQAVKDCLVGVEAEFNGALCNALPNYVEKFLLVGNFISDFCDQRAECWENISDECHDDFYNQQSYVSDCFEKAAQLKTDKEWNAIANDLHVCIQSELPEQEAPQQQEGEISPSQKIQEILREVFAAGLIINPCEKIDGVYKALIDEPPLPPTNPPDPETSSKPVKGKGWGDRGNPPKSIKRGPSRGS